MTDHALLLYSSLFTVCKNSVLKDLEEYKSLSTAIETAKPGFDRSLEHFIRAGAFRSHRGLSEVMSAEYALSFGRELSDLPTRVDLTPFIDGLTIRDSPIVISPALTFCCPVPEDLAEYAMLDEFGGVSLRKGHAQFRVVCEFSNDVVDTGRATG